MTVARVGVAKVWVGELGVAKKRWQKRGDKKEVAQKRWQEWVAGKECDACAVRSGQICDAI